MPTETDFTTFRWLGNTGSVALPLALALGLQSGGLTANSRVALLGIGSGINSVMMSSTWPKPTIAGDLDENALRNLQHIAVHPGSDQIAPPKTTSKQTHSIA